MSAEPLVQCRALSKVFEHGGQGTIALKDIDLSLGDRELLSVVGPSGCGKSTLLRLIAGFEAPSRGECLYRGRPIERPAGDRSYIAQRPTLFPWLTARQNIEFGLQMQGVRETELRATVERLLQVVRLTKFAEHFPHELSGGMQQRVAIARGLAIDPEVVLMDEPFGALDVQTRQIMQDELLRIWGELEASRRSCSSLIASVKRFSSATAWW